MLRDLSRSFRYAGRGVVRSLREERNLRIHFTAVFYVTAAGLLAGLEPVDWAVLLLCFGAVIRAELVNTAVENLCDALHPGPDPKVGAAKDAAAGSVLVLAVLSVGVAGFLFGPWLMGGGLFAALDRDPWIAPAFFISLAPAVAFVLWPHTTKSLENRGN